MKGHMLCKKLNIQCVYETEKTFSFDWKNTNKLGSSQTNLSLCNCINEKKVKITFSRQINIKKVTKRTFLSMIDSRVRSVRPIKGIELEFYHI